MDEKPQYIGVFTVFDSTEIPTEELQEWCIDRPLAEYPGLKMVSAHQNILMASQKTLMANAVYPNISKLVITSQTTTPQDNETSYSGLIYQTVAADEFSRSGGGNPYNIAWNITSNSANGVWGSFILVTSGGSMINRALAGVSKSSGQGRIVQFSGSVT